MKRILLGTILLFAAAPAAANDSPARSLQSLATAPPAVAGQIGADNHWVATKFYSRGPDAAVQSVIVHDGDLVINGGFRFVGPLDAHGLARWDGTAWSTYPGIDAATGFSFEYQGQLGIVQREVVSGSQSRFHVLLWNGSAWDALPDLEASAYYSPFVVQAVEYNGDLVLAGDWSSVSLGMGGTMTHQLIRWNGAAWDSVGADSTSSTRSAPLEIWDGTLVAVRKLPNFTTQIEQWDGTSWTVLVNDPNVLPVDFVVHQGDLLLAYRDAGIMRWNGSSLVPFASGYQVHGMLSLGGDLYVNTSVGLPGNGIQRWDGTSWHAMGNLTRTINGLVDYGGVPVVVGDFTFPLAGRNRVENVAFWNGTAWEGVGPGDGQGLLRPGSVQAMVPFQGELVAGGDMYYPGSLLGEKVSAWDGVSWHPMLVGGEQYVRDLAVYDGDLYAARGFDGLLRYNGAGWDTAAAVGSSEWINSLAVYDGELVVAGSFAGIDGKPAPNIAAWDGSHWKGLGQGLPDPNGFAGRVDHLAVGNGLLAAGSTTMAPMIWNGSHWSDMQPAGTNDVALDVHAIAAYGTRFAVSGTFLFTEPYVDYCVGSWNGADWTDIGLCDSDLPTGLGDYNGYLLAGGYYYLSSHSYLHYLVAFDGSDWYTLGSGVTDGSNSMLGTGYWAFTEYDGDFYVAGPFAATGNKAASGLGTWRTHVVGSVPDLQDPPPAVSAVFPNPVRSGAVIRFQLPRADRVRVDVIDIQGRRIDTVLDERLAAGDHTVRWNPKAGPARPAAGIYFLRIRTSTGTRASRFTILP